MVTVPTVTMAANASTITAVIVPVIVPSSSTSSVSTSSVCYSYCSSYCTKELNTKVLENTTELYDLAIAPPP